MVFKEHPPDTMTKVTRLGCGGAVGLLFGAYITRRHWLNAGPELLIPIVGIAVVFAVAAMVYGERFWRWGD